MPIKKKLRSPISTFFKFLCTRKKNSIVETIKKLLYRNIKKYLFINDISTTILTPLTF